VKRDFRCPDRGVLDRARRGIAVVAEALARRGRDRWAVYAIRAVEVFEDEWVLYVISRRSSLPLTHDMAATLAIERVWISGRVQARVLPADLTQDRPGTAPVSALEVLLAATPPAARTRSGGVRDATSMIAGLVDAHEHNGVRLIIAVPRAPIGWPPG
jgi:hypothetical protein